MGPLLELQRVDVAVGALTVREERASYVDFTTPFLTDGGYALLRAKPSLWFAARFFVPWPAYLWLIGGFLLASLLIWLFDRCGCPYHAVDAEAPVDEFARADRSRP